MHRRNLFGAAGAVLAALLTGCARDAGNKFEGYWREQLPQSNDNNSMVFKFERSGDTQFTITAKRIRNGAVHETKSHHPFINDEVIVDRGILVIRFRYAEGKLHAFGEELTRISRDEFETFGKTPRR